MQASGLVTVFKRNEDIAAHCLEKAAKLKAQPWFNGFESGNRNMTMKEIYMISIWPSWITNKDNPLFKEKRRRNSPKAE